MNHQSSLRKVYVDNSVEIHNFPNGDKYEGVVINEKMCERGNNL